MKKLLNISKYLIFLALAIVLMYFSFKDIKFSDLIDSLRSANYWLIAISVAVGILGYVIRAMRWKILIDSLGYNVPLKNTYNALMTGYLANFAIPRIGEITRCGVIRNTDGVPFEKVLGTVIVERCYDVISLFISLIAVFFVHSERLGNFMSERIFKPFLNRFSSTSILILIIVLLIIAASITLIFVYRNALKRFSFFIKIKKIAKGLLDGLKTAFLMKNKGFFFLFTILIYFCYWITGFLVMKAMPLTSSFTVMDALLIYIIGALGWLVPVQGGFGSYHIMVALGLGLYGISYNDGIIFATISHESQIVFMIILGIISFISVLIMNKNLKIKKT